MVCCKFKQLGCRVYEIQHENDALPNDNSMANLDSEHVNNNDDDVDMMNINGFEMSHMSANSDILSRDD